MCKCEGLAKEQNLLLGKEETKGLQLYEGTANTAVMSS